MTNKAGDVFTATLAILIAVALYVFAQDLDEGPAQMPLLVGSLLGGAGALLMLRALVRGDDTGQLFEGADLGSLTVLLLGWVVMVLLAGTIGFFVMIALFLAMLQWWLAGRPTDSGAMVRAALFSAVTTALLWTVFVGVLNVRFPEAWLF